MLESYHGTVATHWFGAPPPPPIAGLAMGEYRSKEDWVIQGYLAAIVAVYAIPLVRTV